MDGSLLTTFSALAMQRQVVVFRLDRHTFALPIEPVVQIIPMVALTPIPHLAEAVAGILNFHGRAVPVVDLRLHLGLAQAQLQLYTPIVLADIGGRMIGLIVDEVTDVVALAESRIVPPRDVLPEALGQVPAVRGLAQWGTGVVLILDPDHLFRPDQAQALAQAADYVRQHPDLFASGGRRDGRA